MGCNVRSKIIGGHILTMFYDDDNRLTNYTHIGNGPDKDLEYDDRGNVKRLGGLFFTYDKSDQPINISGTAAGTYRYDGHKRRVKAVVGGKTIYNIYDASGTLVQVDELPDAATGTIGKTTDYIGKIARIAKIGSAETLTYLHHDHLGSVSAGTTDIGLVSWREQYAPFGFALNQHAVGKNQAGFTGHVHDGATGLLYMQARYYDPYIGRFLSVDPVGFTPEMPEMFGRYTYVNNDPVNAWDPFGLEEEVKKDSQQTGSRLKNAASSAVGFVTSFEVMPNWNPSSVGDTIVSNSQLSGDVPKASVSNAALEITAKGIVEASPEVAATATSIAIVGGAFIVAGEVVARAGAVDGAVGYGVAAYGQTTVTTSYAAGTFGPAVSPLIQVPAAIQPTGAFVSVAQTNIAIAAGEAYTIRHGAALMSARGFQRTSAAVAAAAALSRDSDNE